MRSLALFFFIFVLFDTINAQEKPDVEAEVREFFRGYEKCVSLFADTTASKDTLNKYKKALRDKVVATNILVPNDQRKSANDSLIKLSDYLRLLERQYPSGFESALNLPKLEISGLLINPDRNSHQVTATVKRRFIYPEVSTEIVDSFRVDTVLRKEIVIVDTVEVEKEIMIFDTVYFDVISYDTTWEKNFTELTFYFTTKIMWNKYQPLLLEAIQVTGRLPEYAEALGELTAWWVDLEDDWRKKILDQINLPAVPHEHHLERVYSIKEIDVSGVDPKDFGPLLKLKGLKILDLSKTGLDTLLILENFPKLEQLTVSRNNLKSLEGVQKCPNLLYLNCGYNEIEDLSPLEGCPNMMTLLLSNNKVEDLTVVSKLPRLLTLHFQGNIVKDLSPLRNLGGLKNLNMAKNKDIESLEPIRNCLALGKLNCYNTGITSLDPIRRMENIYHLDIGYIKISSLDAIRHMKNLSYLNISGNVLTDFSAVSHFRKLRSFYCNTTRMSDIGPVLNMTEIREFSAISTSFSKSDIQRLKKKYPKCAITYY